MISLAPAKWHSEGRWDIANLQPVFKEATSPTKLAAEQVTFSQNGVATILLKQDYTKLFYLQSQSLKYPIESVTLTFNDVKNVRAMTITIYKQQLLSQEKKEQGKDWSKRGSYIEMVLYYDQEGMKGQEPIRQLVSTILFPQAEQAPLMLHKNIWVELNGLNQTIRILDGDIAAPSNKPLFSYNFMIGSHTRDTWDTAEDKYQMPAYVNPKNQHQEQPSSYNPRTKDFMNNLKYLDVSVQIQAGTIKEKQKYKQSLADFFEVRFMPLVRVFDSVIDAQPSLLNPKGAVLPAMSKGLNLIYGYLKDFNLLHLPNYPIGPEDSGKSLLSRQQYFSWRQLNFAIHFSLTTPYGYRSQGGKLIPYGILNHLYQLKNDKKWTPLDFNRSLNAYSGDQKQQKSGEQKQSKSESNNKEKSPNFPSRKELMEHIYNQRQGYIRLQLQSHLGLSPGSMAVLQVWPPFSCSPIHNHGDADGMIKVVSGTIHVQNFSQLSFNNFKDAKPSQQRDYSQDQYTWLSQYSFGIHRLVNLHNQTCLSLQSYYNNENDTKQYFSFIEDDKQKGYNYAQYYPQNDWKNYLFWQKPKQQIKGKHHDKDYKFIQDVIRQYGLNSDLQKHQLQGEITQDRHIDWSFERLVMVLRQEYQYALNFDSKIKIQKQNKNVIFWLYDQQTQFEKASQKVIDHYGKDNIQIQSANDFESYLNLVSQGVKTMGKRIALVANVTQYDHPNSNVSVSLQVLKQLQRLVGLGCTLAVAFHDRLQLKSALKVNGSNSMYLASSLEQFFKLTPWSPQ